MPAAPPAPPPPVVPPPPPPPPEVNRLNTSFGVRTALRLQDPYKPQNMNEVHFDQGYSNVVEARFWGDVTKEFGWRASFNANLTNSNTLGGTAPSLAIMDLIAQFNPMKEFHIWAGRLLVPSDRSNFSGPFFMSPWNYPGFYLNGAPPLGPKDGPTGRDQGVTFWGNALEDKLKYFAGAYGLDQGDLGSIQPATANPYYSARVSYSLQGSEPGYFGQSTNYGGDSFVTIGLGGQYQKDGASSTSDYGLFMADVVAEENLTNTGTFTFEGQFYKFSDNAPFAGTAAAPISAPKEAGYVLLSYLTPNNIGVGKLQPLVRLQATADPGWTIFDGALAYVFQQYWGKIVLTYQHIDTGGLGPQSNSLQLGFQMQK